MGQSASTEPAVRLEARPLGIFLNCGYGIYDGGRRIAKIKFDDGVVSWLSYLDVLGLSILWDKGYLGWVITPTDRYRIQKNHKFVNTRFYLLQGKTPVAEAQEQFFPPVIMLEHNGQEYRLQPGETIKEQLVMNNRVVGYAKPPRSLFSRKVHFLLPKRLPVKEQLLLMWMYLYKQF
jgi:hemin uptake protein HemP